MEDEMGGHTACMERIKLHASCVAGENVRKESLV